MQITTKNALWASTRQPRSTLSSYFIYLGQDNEGKTTTKLTLYIIKKTSWNLLCFLPLLPAVCIYQPCFFLRFAKSCQCLLSLLSSVFSFVRSHISLVEVFSVAASGLNYAHAVIASHRKGNKDTLQHVHQGLI